MGILHNLEATLWSDTKRIKRYFHILYEVTKEHM